jgi:hypothetical protein
MIYKFISHSSVCILSVKGKWCLWRTEAVGYLSEHVHIHRPKLNQHVALRTLNGLLPAANLYRLCTFLQQVYFVGQISGTTFLVHDPPLWLRRALSIPAGFDKSVYKLTDWDWDLNFSIYVWICLPFSDHLSSIILLSKKTATLSSVDWVGKFVFLVLVP